MTIGGNIKRLRVEAGMSQEQLGKLLGKTRSAVSYYESDTIVPRMGVIEDLAAIFNVSKTDIIEPPKEERALSTNEREIVDIIRSMSTEGQRQLMIYARGLLATYPKNNPLSQVS